MWKMISLISLTLGLVVSAAAEETPPIWLNEDVYGIARIEDFERRLNQLFPADADISLPARYGRPQRWVRNCADYLERHFEEGLRIGDLVSTRYLVFYMLRPCVLLKYLKWARPAERSFVRDGLFEGPLPDLFPADFRASASCQQSRYELGREREAVVPTWKESALTYDSHFMIEFVSASQAILSEADNNLHDIDALARADFDGDGFEDVLVSLASWGTSGRSGSRFRRYGPWEEVAILTREAPGGRFRTLYSEAGESCFYFNLEKWKDYAEPWERKKADRFRPPYKLEDLGPPVC